MSSAALTRTSPRAATEGFFCRDCGHEDNERDPETGRVVGPLHGLRLATSGCACPTHAEVTEVTPDHQVVRPLQDLVNWCLVCGRACFGGFRYESIP